MTPERLAFSTRITKYTKKELISLAVEQYDRICEMEIRDKENSRINTEAHISYKKLESELTDLKKENLTLKAALQKEIDKNLVLNRKVYGRATEKFIDSLQGTNGEEHIDEAETEDNEQDGHPSRVIDITALQGKPVHAETEGDQKTSQTSGSANRFCRYHGQGKQAGTHNKLNAAADSLPQDVHYQFDPEAYDEKYGEGNWRIAFWQETKTIEKLPLSYYQKVVYTPVISSGLEHVLSNEQTPPHLINRSLASPSLVADIFYRKVFLSLPNGRQERDYKISGLPLSKQTMIQWTNQLTQEVLTVPYQYLSTLLLRLKYTQNDETYMQVNKDGRGAGSKSFLWVHCSSELLDCPPIIIFCYEKTRGTDHLRKFFKEFSGYITCDAYAAYQTFAKEHPETDDVTGCMMHCRRYFAIAFFVHDFKNLSDQQILELPETTAILKIKEIYSEENKLKGLSAEDRLRERQAKVRPKVDEFFRYVHELAESGGVFSDRMNAAITYAVNQEERLRMFLRDGNIPIDNGHVERVISSFSVGRANWKFSDTIPGAESMAILYSLAETAKANNADVRLYFQYLLEKVPRYQDLNGAVKDDKVLETFTPWSDTYRQYEKEQKQSAAERFQMMFPQPIRPKTPKKRAEKIA